MQQALFISDLHLNVDDQETTLKFQNFLTSPAAEQADELYILGDLFALWLGDDCITSYELGIAEKIRQYSYGKLDRKVYFMPGNRDFLIGEKFLNACNMRLIPDPYVINDNILLTHGDKLCTNDRGYQFYRRIAQNKITKYIFLSLPQKLRTCIAGLLKRPDIKPRESSYKFDATKEGINRIVQEINFSGKLIIHGHTHIPACNHMTPQLTQIILGDWQYNQKYLLLFKKTCSYNLLP